MTCGVGGFIAAIGSVLWHAARFAAWEAPRAVWTLIRDAFPPWWQRVLLVGLLAAPAVRDVPPLLALLLVVLGIHHAFRLAVLLSRRRP